LIENTKKKECKKSSPRTNRMGLEESEAMYNNNNGVSYKTAIGTLFH